MTAKRRGGKLARLEALEAKRAARVEEVRAYNWALIERAEGLLSPADRASLEDAKLLGVGEIDPEELAHINAVLEGLGLTEPPDYQHPAKEEAEAWADAALDVPEGVPLLAPPVGRVADFVACFEVEAAAFEEQARAFPSSPEVQRVARWAVALTRFTARLCEVLALEDWAA